MRRFLLIGLSLLNFLIVFSQGISLRMDPILVTKNVQAGASFSYEIFLENGDEFDPVTLKVLVLDIVENLEGAYDLKEPGSTRYSIAKFVKVEPSVLTISPKETKIVRVTVNVPKNASGGLYGAIAFEIQSTEPTGERPAEEGAYGELEFKYRMASFLEVTVEGGRKVLTAFPSHFLVERSENVPSAKTLVGEGALVFTLGVLNKSNVHIVTKGTLTIKTSDGRTIAKMPLGGGRGVILPEATVNMRTITRRNLPPGEYVARAVVEYGSQRPIVVEKSFVISSEGIGGKEEKREEHPIMLVVDPMNLEIMTSPGAFRSETVKVTNLGKEEIQVTASVYPLLYDLYGEPVPKEERGVAPSWIEVTPVSFSLKPNQSRNVRVSVRVPKEFSGSYYADLMFRTEGNLQAEVGANLLVFAGKAESITKKASVDMTHQVMKGEGVYLDIVFENVGNYHLSPTFVFALDKVKPQTVTEEGLIVPEESQRLIQQDITTNYPVLPNTKRVYRVFIPMNLEPGTYNLLVRCDFGGENPVILRKTFQIEGSDGE